MEPVLQGKGSGKVDATPPLLASHHLLNQNPAATASKLLWDRNRNGMDEMAKIPRGAAVDGSNSPFKLNDVDECLSHWTDDVASCGYRGVTLRIGGGKTGIGSVRRHPKKT